MSLVASLRGEVCALDGLLEPSKRIGMLQLLELR